MPYESRDFDEQFIKVPPPGKTSNCWRLASSCASCRTTEPLSENRSRSEGWCWIGCGRCAQDRLVVSIVVGHFAPAAKARCHNLPATDLEQPERLLCSSSLTENIIHRRISVAFHFVRRECWQCR